MRIDDGTPATSTSPRWVNRLRIPLITLIVATALGIYWAALFYGTHTKIPKGLIEGNTDKVIHFSAYAGLGALLMAVRATRGSYPWIGILQRFFILATYAVFDEVTQKFVNRTPDFHDWLADVFGATAGLLTVTFLVWCYRKGLKTPSIEVPTAESAIGGLESGTVEI